MATLGRFIHESFLPLKNWGNFKMAIGRDFLEYERTWVYFCTINLHKTVNIAPERRGRRASATANLRPLIARFYRKSDESL